LNLGKKLYQKGPFLRPFYLMTMKPSQNSSLFNADTSVRPVAESGILGLVHESPMDKVGVLKTGNKDFGNRMDIFVVNSSALPEFLSRLDKGNA
jgi:hypothetical protein